jgi:hypothetical protein
MTQTEALRLALEALEWFDTNAKTIHEIQVARPSVLALRQAIAEAEKQEPVAWMRTSGTGSPVVTEELLAEMPEMRWNFQQPLYTTPPQRKPLTDEEIIDHFKASVDTGFLLSFVDGVRYAEAAHGIKGEV